MKLIQGFHFYDINTNPALSGNTDENLFAGMGQVKKYICITTLRIQFRFAILSRYKRYQFWILVGIMSQNNAQYPMSEDIVSGIGGVPERRGNLPFFRAYRT